MADNYAGGLSEFLDQPKLQRAAVQADPGFAFDPFARAALRQRSTVKPEGGRQEGPVTAAIEQYGAVPAMAAGGVQALRAIPSLARGIVQHFRPPVPAGAGAIDEAALARSVEMLMKRNPAGSIYDLAGIAPEAVKPLPQAAGLPPWLDAAAIFGGGGLGGAAVGQVHNQRSGQ